MADLGKSQSSWTYGHARGLGHHFSRAPVTPSAAVRRGPGHNANTTLIALHGSGSPGREGSRHADAVGEYAVPERKIRAAGGAP